ncbi:hypothetical protein E4U43_005424 [Claviceps pusilla]|uniref:Uncharacterized protein n=1 Tax=Claviceps pusilla TaxID=123648 RepID=A0A9P7NGS5_9HYPO|nr:hypothetical protein E4U43_005424 [Claviceps pusilla]
MKALFPFLTLLVLALASHISLASNSVAAPNASSSPAPGTQSGAYCECGYTYCASVLMAMKKPWTMKQLGDAYCATSHAVCSSGRPSTGINTALFICLCNDPGQKYGTTLDLVCASPFRQALGSKEDARRAPVSKSTLDILKQHDDQNSDQTRAQLQRLLEQNNQHGRIHHLSSRDALKCRVALPVQVLIPGYGPAAIDGLECLDA